MFTAALFVIKISQLFPNNLGSLGNCFRPLSSICPESRLRKCPQTWEYPH